MIPTPWLFAGIALCVLIVAWVDDPRAHSAALGLENEELREELAEAQEALRERVRECGSLYTVVNADGTLRCAQLVPGMNGSDWRKLTGRRIR